MSECRFWLLVAATVVGLAVATLLVAALGDRTEPLPIAVLPIDGADDVAATASITIRFGRPVDRDRLAAHLRIEPPAAGELEVDRGVARFTPFGGLRPGVTYAVTIEAGFADATGRSLRRPVRSAFATRPARLVVARPEPHGPADGAPRNLWLVDLAGGPMRPLTREAYGVLYSSVAPDGRSVAYSAPDADAPDRSALWVVGLDGVGRRRVVGSDDGVVLAVAWSPRGDVIAFERRPVLGPGGQLGRPRILAVRPDGGGGGLLYGRGDDAGALPVWSPDGRRLLVADATGRGRVVVDPAGESFAVPAGGAESGTWSPDGRLFAFADLDRRADLTASSLRVATRDGVRVADLARPGFSDLAPAWSPAGDVLAAVGEGRDGDLRVWLIDPNGDRPARAVALPATGSVVGIAPPVWSPGGALLAIGRLAAAAAGEGASWELWVVDGDGTNPRRLSVDGLPEGWAP